MSWDAYSYAKAQKAKLRRNRRWLIAAGIPIMLLNLYLGVRWIWAVEPGALEIAISAVNLGLGAWLGWAVVGLFRHDPFLDS